MVWQVKFFNQTNKIDGLTSKLLVPEVWWLDHWNWKSKWWIQQPGYWWSLQSSISGNQIANIGRQNNVFDYWTSYTSCNACLWSLNHQHRSQVWHLRPLNCWHRSLVRHLLPLNCRHHSQSEVSEHQIAGTGHEAESLATEPSLPVARVMSSSTKLVT